MGTFVIHLKYVSIDDRMDIEFPAASDSSVNLMGMVRCGMRTQPSVNYPPVSLKINTHHFSPLSDVCINPADDES